MTEPPFGGDPDLRALSAHLLSHVDQLGAELTERIRSADPVYRDGRIVTAEDLRETCTANLVLVFSRLAGKPPVSTEAPAQTGRRRAEQGMPLPTTLRAYRIGGRFIWDVLRRHTDTSAVSQEALLQAAGDVWAIIDDYSEAVSAAFRETLADQARRDTEVRTAVLSSVLEGHFADPSQLGDAANILQLPRRGTYIVVAARTRAAGTEPLPRAEQVLRRLEIPSAWRLDDRYQTGILCLPQRVNADQACAELAAVAVAAVGVSASYTGLELTPPAARKARIACLSATPGSTELVRYEQHPIATLLAGAPDDAVAVAHSVLGPLFALTPTDRDQLLETLRSWYAHHASATDVGKDLHVHRNTVRYRLRRVQTLTRRDLSDPVTISEIHVALEATRIFTPHLVSSG